MYSVCNQVLHIFIIDSIKRMMTKVDCLHVVLLDLPGLCLAWAFVLLTAHS